MSAGATSEGVPEAGVLDGLLRDIARLNELTATWDEHHLRVLKARDTAVEALHREALMRLLRRIKSIDAARDALRDAAADEVVYTVLRHLELLKPSLQERLETALESVRPLMKSHQGDVKLVAVNPPEVTLRLLGACQGCPASELTLKMGVEKAIKQQCPEITHIRNAGAVVEHHHADIVSPFAETRPWLRAVPLDELSEGQVKFIALEQRSVLLYRAGGRVKCYDNSCAHLGAPLDDGVISAGRIVCPLHRFDYLLDSGECLTVPGVQLQAYPCRTTNNWVEVQLS